MGWLWLYKIFFLCSRWCAISEYVFLFLVHFPLWLLVIFLHIHQSSQSSLFLTLVLRCERVSLLCCLANALMMSRREGRGVPTATSLQSHEVMSKKACCQEGAGCASASLCRSVPAQTGAVRVVLGVLGTARHCTHSSVTWMDPPCQHAIMATFARGHLPHL